MRVSVWSISLFWVYMSVLFLFVLFCFALLCGFCFFWLLVLRWPLFGDCDLVSGFFGSLFVIVVCSSGLVVMVSCVDFVFFLLFFCSVLSILKLCIFFCFWFVPVCRCFLLPANDFYSRYRMFPFCGCCSLLVVISIDLVLRFSFSFYLGHERGFFMLIASHTFPSIVSSLTSLRSSV